MRKYLAKGCIIVHGQKIPIIQDIYFGDAPQHVVIAVKNKLKLVFNKEGDTIELDNCVFEKDACSGLFVEVEDIGNAYTLFERILLKLDDMWPFKWK